MIKIERYKHNEVSLFKGNALVGVLFNDIELNKIQVQIADGKLEGYNVVWREHNI